jgi:hypothetical protein
MVPESTRTPEEAQPATTFIYALVEPRPGHPNFGRVRYVGKSNQPKERLQRHLKWDKANERKSRWLAQLSSIGMEPQLVILEECAFEDWQAREHYWEQHLRMEGEPLTNLAEGGRGRIYYTATEEYREKCRQAQAKLNGDPERRAKRSASARRRWTDPDFRARMYTARIGKKRSTDFCSQMREKTIQTLERWKETGTAPPGQVKYWEGFVSPEGEAIEPIWNLTAWCAERGFKYQGMRLVYLGTNPSYRGWTCNRPEAVAARAARGLPPSTSPQSRRGQPRTEATRLRMQEAQITRYGRVWVGFRTPDGTPVEAFQNLRIFCEANGLSRFAMWKVYHGERPHHKGWTCPRPTGPGGQLLLPL